VTAAEPAALRHRLQQRAAQDDESLAEMALRLQTALRVRSVPIRLAQTHTICSGGDPKNQGFKEL
jgi:hypothetical protein